MFTPRRCPRTIFRQSLVSQRLAQARNSSFTRPPSRAHLQSRAPPRKATRAAAEPFVFAAAFTVSIGIAYTVDLYRSHLQQAQTGVEEGAGHKHILIPAHEAQEFFHIMAPSMPPGRPGNLTADQEAKLKEMWAQTLDIFGVAHDSSHAHANGTSTPSTPEPSSEKKKKSRMGLFGKKNKQEGDASSTSDGAENDKHGQALEYKQALADMSPEELREAFWSMVKHDHPDAVLLRFLRARKFDVNAALIMLISTMHWRSKEMHLDDDIMRTGELGEMKKSQSSDATAKKDGEGFVAQLRMGKSFLHGTDKDGRPCCFVRVKLHKAGEQSEKSLERYTVYTIETARMMLRPPIDTATIVFDMTDFSLANMDYTPVKFMIKCFEANYPESLGSVLVYKSPWVFQGIWKIIKGWLDPVVASKVHFASNVSDLQEYIPRPQIPKELGGDEDYVYSYPEPAEGEVRLQAEGGDEKAKIEAERTELVKSYEAETHTWINGEDKGEGRLRLAQRIAENYWRLDPYVRARSMYDRTGVIGKDGKLDFYPKAAPAAAANGSAADGDLD